MSGRELNRRDFVAACGATAVAAAASGAPAAADEPADGRYVDIHTHLGHVWNTSKPVTAEVLLAWMDASQIAQSIVLPLVSPEASSYPCPPDFVLNETKAHRDRLIPFCIIDPRTTLDGGRRGLMDMLKRYRDLGAKGFGEHKPGVKVDDPRNLLLYELCGELKLPILFHLDNERNMDRPGLPGLEGVLKRFPQTTFIGHGPGWWASISGDASQTDLNGYPTGKVKPGGALDRLMDKYPNIYGDLSAGSGSNAISRDEQFGPEFIVRRADRLMFGTDFLSPGQDIPQLRLYRLLKLPSDVQAKVFRDNARKLLGVTA